MKNIITFLLLILSFCCVFAEERHKDVSGHSVPDIESYSQRELLKNWTLSICFATITKDASTKKDAGTTASGYAEFGGLSVEERDDLLVLIQKYIARKYSGHETKSEFNTMKCIDLFYSTELDRLIDKFLKERDRQE